MPTQPLPPSSMRPNLQGLNDRAATTRLLTTLGTIYLLFVFYGCWVPLHFQYVPLADAWQVFSALPFLDQSIASATDWATNFLLLIPLSCLWAQRFETHRHGFFVRLSVLVACIALACFLEFSQLYFSGRTVSQKDILALSLGALAGVIVQSRWGASIEHWLGMLWQRESHQARLIRLLHVYLLVLFVFSVLPLDLTLSLVEIYHKWREGRVVLVPFSGLKGGPFDNAYETVTDLLIWVPVGLFWALERKSTLLKVAAVGWLAAGLIECAQLFVYSRVTDVTDILLGGVGSALGGWLADRGRQTRFQLNDVPARFWGFLWILWALTILALFWFPYDFSLAEAGISELLQAATRLPFLMLFQQSELHAANEILRKIGYFLPGGMLLGLYLAAIRNRSGEYKAWSSWRTTVSVALVAIIVEGGQLFLPGKYADVTDALLETGGALLGLLVISWVLGRQSARDKSGACLVEVPTISSPSPEETENTEPPTALGGDVELPQAQADGSLRATPMTPLDFLPVALALIGLAFLANTTNLFSLPPPWSVFSVACILVLVISSRFPVVTVFSYLLAAYALPRYTPEYVLLIQAGLFDWICLIGFSGWAVWSARLKSWPDWRHPICLVFFAFLILLALSWTVAAWHNTFLEYFPRHTPLLFVHALVLFLIASNLEFSNRSLVSWGLILCALPSLRWYLQSDSGIYLDGDISSLSTFILPIAVVGSYYVRRMWIRTLFLASALSMLGIIGLAQNRAAGVSLILSLLYLFWRAYSDRRLAKKRKGKRQLAEDLSQLPGPAGSKLKKIVLPITILLLLSASFALLPLKDYQARFSVLWNPDATHATAGLDRATIQERYELWSGGIEMALDNPIIGVGPGNFARLIGIYQVGKSKLPPHNTLIAIAAEAGFIGLALFVMLIGFGFRALGHASRSSRPIALQPASIALQASMVAFLAASMFISRHDQVFLYVLLGFAVALSVALKTGALGENESTRHSKHPVDGQPRQVLSGSPVRMLTNPAAQLHMGHLGGFDGLRAIAALSVFGVHFNQLVGLNAKVGPVEVERWLANGNTGVALFFILSGFLLSLPFWRQQHASGPSIDLKAFYVRRLARILPAYYLCLIGVLAVMFAAGRTPAIANVISHILFTYNIDDRTILSLNAPFWSLAVEMQFYLLLPLLMVTLSRLSARTVFALLVLLTIGTYCANYGLMTYLLARNEWPIDVSLIWPVSLYISGPTSFVLTYSLLAHLTYFFFGITAALVFVLTSENNQSSARRQKGHTADLIFWACAISVFLVLSTPLDDLLRTPHGHYNWPFIPFLLSVMVFAISRARTAKRVLESPPLRYLGMISYGVYIFHYPIQKSVARLFGQFDLRMADYWWLFGALSLAVTIAVAKLSYHYLERPLMERVRDGSARTETP